MDPIKIGHVSNADVYLANNRLAGRCKEFDPGDFAMKLVSHEALGMIGVLELPGRAVDAIKATITWDFLEDEVQRTILNPTKLNRFALHSHVDVFGSEGLDTAASHRLVTTVGVYFSSLGGGGHSLGEMLNRELEVTVPILTVKASNSEVPILEYDVFAGVHRVNGENVWPE